MRGWLLLGVVALISCTRGNQEQLRPKGVTCGDPQVCARGAYSLCAAGNQCEYQTSDGGDVRCDSCQSCGGALAIVAAWCAGGSNPGGSTTSGGGTTSSGGTTVGRACDLVPQDCPAGSTPKCSLVDLGSPDVPSLAARCVPLTGSAGEGQPCTATEVGQDSCAAGLLCTDAGRATGDNVCRPLCSSDTDCTGASQCLGVIENGGICVDTCTLLSPGCPGALICSSVFDDVDMFDTTTGGTHHLLSLCRSAGTSTGSCARDSDCTTNFDCEDGTCVAFCDDSHACLDPNTFCLPLAGRLANNAGTCN